MTDKTEKRALYGVTTPTFAMTDKAINMAPLFRPSFRGVRPRGLDITHTFNSGMTLRYVNFEALDVDDQSVLLGALGLAGIARKTLDKESQGEISRKLWLALGASDDAMNDESVIIHTSYYQLLDAAGYEDKTGQNRYKQLSERIDRLSQVGCFVRANGLKWSMKLLSFVEDESDKSIRIAFNGRLAAALVGEKTIISLVERHTLKSDISKLTHCWLSGWAKFGQANRIGVAKLTGNIYGDASSNPATQRSRWAEIRKALAEIDDLPGWTVKIAGKGSKAQAEIWRSREAMKNLSFGAENDAECRFSENVPALAVAC